MSYAIGIDLGGSSVKTVAATAEGRTFAQSSMNFDVETTMDWAQKVREILEQIQREQKTAPSHIGLSAPGLAAKDGRSIAHMPGRLQGLEGLDWTSFLKSPHPVPVLNDAHAALLGEAWTGAARGFQNVIMLTLGTGAGGAAAGGVVELGEAHAAAREAIQIGGVDLASIAAEIGVAHVVGQDEEDVRTLVCRGAAEAGGKHSEEMATVQVHSPQCYQRS